MSLAAGSAGRCPGVVRYRGRSRSSARRLFCIAFRQGATTSAREAQARHLQFKRCLCLHRCVWVMNAKRCGLKAWKLARPSHNVFFRLLIEISFAKTDMGRAYEIIERCRRPEARSPRWTWAVPLILCSLDFATPYTSNRTRAIELDQVGCGPRRICCLLRGDAPSTGRSSRTYRCPHNCLRTRTLSPPPR